MVRVVVCEYNGSVVNVNGDKLKEYECGCGEKKEELKSEGRRVEGVRWNDVCKCSRCV